MIINSRWNCSLDISGTSPANAGYQKNIVEQEQAAVLPDPGAGAGGDKVVPALHHLYLHWLLFLFKFQVQKPEGRNLFSIVVKAVIKILFARCCLHVDLNLFPDALLNS